MLKPFAAAVLLAVGLCALLPAAEAPKAPGKYMVYFGTYTRGTKSKGIYKAEYDPATGKLGEPTFAGKADNPTFLAIHPNGKFLYAVAEVDDFDKKTKGGAIHAYAINDKGDLKLLNRESSGGGAPCHLVVDMAGKFVLAANYTGGSAIVLPIGEDGKLGKVTGFVQHTGKGPNKGRQEKAHAHSINLDAANNFAFVADLGIDKVMVYQFSRERGTLTANDPPSVSLAAGAGPRHLAFHPSGKYAYVNNELDSTITAMAYDAKAGKLTPIGTLSTLPKEHKGNTTAEVVVHPNGKFLYVSNRGHNSIAQFLIEKDGKLVANGHISEGINIPRNFCLDPAGKFCLVANQDGDSVLVFKVNQRTGALEKTDGKIAVPRPVCVRFLTWK